MKKVIQFTIKVEIDDDNVGVEIIDVDAYENNELPQHSESVDTSITTFSIEGGDFTTNSTYHGSEEEWYITYKE